MKEIKDRLARENGYPNWDVMYCWISRKGEFPEVVAQQVEAFMAEASDLYCIEMIYLYVSANEFQKNKDKMSFKDYIKKWISEQKT